MDILIRERMRNALDALVNGDNQLEPRPKRIVLVAPGNSVPDDSCCDGQLSARLVSLTPKVTRPTANGLMGGCNPDWWDAVVEIKVVRCAHVVKDSGAPPTAAEMTEDGLQNLKDLDRMVTAILELDFVSSIGTWNPTGPQGGCMGSTITFTMRV